METKIIFLLLAILMVYFIFTPTGQAWAKKVVGVNISSK
jgi:hypothetical protein